MSLISIVSVHVWACAVNLKTGSQCFTFDFSLTNVWIVFLPGQDDMQIRVFNYNTLERVHMFEAHSDYIRCIAVHPTQPYILTSSGKPVHLNNDG